MLSHELTHRRKTATAVLAISMRCTSSIVEEEPRYVALSSSSSSADAMK